MTVQMQECSPHVFLIKNIDLRCRFQILCSRIYICNHEQHFQKVSLGLHACISKALWLYDRVCPSKLSAYFCFSTKVLRTATVCATKHSVNRTVLNVVAKNNIK